ncbi:hypothetical protein [Natrialba magadii]|uniref:hypothetical protein n=1 Tax=Natrialba magadii TaxID=13769 RepID=UPI00174B1944|nr:hypothetical protein [Natrialba magadii]
MVLVSVALVSVALVSVALVSVALVSVALVSVALVSVALVSVALVSVALVSVALVSVALVSMTLKPVLLTTQPQPSGAPPATGICSPPIRVNGCHTDRFRIQYLLLTPSAILTPIRFPHPSESAHKHAARFAARADTITRYDGHSTESID